MSRRQKAEIVRLALLLHAGIFALGIVGYIVLTVANHDGNAVLTAALGYAGGAAAQKAATEALKA